MFRFAFVLHSFLTWHHQSSWRHKHYKANGKKFCVRMKLFKYNKNYEKWKMRDEKLLGNKLIKIKKNQMQMLSLIMFLIIFFQILTIYMLGCSIQHICLFYSWKRKFTTCVFWRACIKSQWMIWRCFLDFLLDIILENY